MKLVLKVSLGQLDRLSRCSGPFERISNQFSYIPVRVISKLRRSDCSVKRHSLSRKRRLIAAVRSELNTTDVFTGVESLSQSIFRAVSALTCEQTYSRLSKHVSLLSWRRPTAFFDGVVGLLWLITAVTSLCFFHNKCLPTMVELLTKLPNKCLYCIFSQLSRQFSWFKITPW